MLVCNHLLIFDNLVIVRLDDSNQEIKHDNQEEEGL